MSKEVNIYDETHAYRPKDPNKIRLFSDMMSRIPQKIRDKLNVTCLHIIQIMLSMGTYARPDGRFYLDTMYFSEEWLAKQCSRSRVHISNMIRRLEDLGVIKVVRRRLPNGRFKTNLYRLTGRFLQYFGIWKYFVKSIIHERKKKLKETITDKIEKYKRFIRKYMKGKSLSEYLFDMAIGQEWERWRYQQGVISKKKCWKNMRELGRVAFFIPSNPVDYELFLQALKEIEETEHVSFM